MFISALRSRGQTVCILCQQMCGHRPWQTTGKMTSNTSLITPANAQYLFITYIYCVSPTCIGVPYTIIRQKLRTHFLKITFRYAAKYVGETQ